MKIELIAHYTTAKIAIEKILPNNSLRFNKLKNSNDPWEFKKNIHVNLNDNIFKMFNDLKRKDNLNSFYENIKSISFSTDDLSTSDKKIECYKNSLMWAHYGNNHKGVCFVFDKKALTNLFVNQHGKQILINENVSYLENPCGIVIKDESSSFNKQVVIEKRKEWSYENEFRLSIIPSNEDRFISNISESLLAIVIGGNFPEVYKCCLLEIKEKGFSNIKLCQIHYDPNGFYYLSGIDDKSVPCVI